MVSIERKAELSRKYPWDWTISELFELELTGEEELKDLVGFCQFHHPFDPPIPITQWSGAEMSPEDDFSYSGVEREGTGEWVVYAYSQDRVYVNISSRERNHFVAIPRTPELAAKEAYQRWASKQIAELEQVMAVFQEEPKLAARQRDILSEWMRYWGDSVSS